MEVKPYTYLLINDTSWYIGVRCANKVPAEQDVGYMSSSTYVTDRIKSGEVFTKHILGEYETKAEASKAEDAYLREYWDVPGRINKALGFNYEFDDEVRSKHSAACKAAHNSPEVRAKKSAASKVAQNRPEVKAKICKPCTIDGVTIYQSVVSLISELGKGKAGYRHPDFRYT